MPRSLVILLSCAFLLLGSLATAVGATAATIAPTTTCSNNVDTTPGLGLICEVTVINTITGVGGTAEVTVRECHGAAGDPEAACTTDTQVLTSPVTAVTQCNDSISRGGTLRCSVQVTNNFVDSDPGETAATVNQCVGSGDGDGTGCDPFPASTTGADITQCNGSANGGTLVELTCTATGTQSPGLSVTINQCNGSANGGGSLVICSANIDNSQVAGATPAPTAAPTASPAGGGATTRPTSNATPPPTDALATIEESGPGSTVAVLLGLIAVASIVFAATRRRLRTIRQR